MNSLIVVGADMFILNKLKKKVSGVSECYICGIEIVDFCFDDIERI